MGAHRGFADPELVGDGAVGVARRVGHQPQHLQLAGRELHPGIGPRAAQPLVPRAQPLLQPTVGMQPTTGHGAEAMHQLRARHAQRQHPHHPGFHGALHQQGCQLTDHHQGGLRAGAAPPQQGRHTQVQRRGQLGHHHLRRRQPTGRGGGGQGIQPFARVYHL